MWFRQLPSYKPRAGLFLRNHCKWLAKISVILIIASTAFFEQPLGAHRLSTTETRLLANWIKQITPTLTISNKKAANLVPGNSGGDWSLKLKIPGSQPGYLLRKVRIIYAIFLELK